MKRISGTAVLACFSCLAAVMAVRAASTYAADRPRALTPPYPLPYSSLLSDEVRERFRYLEETGKVSKQRQEKTCGSSDGQSATRVAEVKKCQIEFLYDSAFYRDLRKRYRVMISDQEIGGVPTQVFTPADGVAPENSHRVLINLHGGGFRIGWRTISHFESIPIASVGKIKVISVDYRMAPEFSFPAASEDVVAVYAEVSKTYDPKSIGIFGCSAGGLLTAQSIAWFQKRNLPMPGAVGMFCEGASYWSEGDSGYFATLWEERPPTLLDDQNFEYLRNADPNDWLAYPVRSKEVMSRFPPSLLIASTRDLALSSVVYTHSVLVQQGVPAELYIWEGLPHSFFVDPELPQSREMYAITTKFFDKYLGKVDALSERRGSVGHSL